MVRICHLTRFPGEKGEVFAKETDFAIQNYLFQKSFQEFPMIWDLLQGYLGKIER